MPNYEAITKTAYMQGCVAFGVGEYLTWDELDIDEALCYIKTVKVGCKLCKEYAKGDFQLYERLLTVNNQNRRLIGWKHGAKYDYKQKIDPDIVSSFNLMGNESKLDFMLYWDTVHSIVSFLPKDTTHE